MPQIARCCTVLLLLAAASTGAPVAQEREPSLGEQLRELKALCDQDLIDPEVCKEKQRTILGLPPAAPRPEASDPDAAGSPDPALAAAGAPVHTHTSPLGFTVDLPAGWRVLETAEVEAGLELLAERLGDDPATRAVLDATRKYAEHIGGEAYAKEDQYIKVAKEQTELLAAPGTRQALCDEIAGNRAHVAGRRVAVHECSYGVVSGVPSFCMDLDAMAVGKRTRQCWLAKPPGGTLRFTVTFDPGDPAVLSAFEAILASIAWP